jgi:hypothetical protein
MDADYRTDHPVGCLCARSNLAIRNLTRLLVESLFDKEQRKGITTVTYSRPSDICPYNESAIFTIRDRNSPFSIFWELCKIKTLLRRTLPTPARAPREGQDKDAASATAAD